jgi:hypothetical protein
VDRHCVALAAALAGAVTACAGAESEPATPNAKRQEAPAFALWTRHESAPGRFSVLMPGAATQVEVEEQTEYGTVIHHKAFAEDDAAGVAVAVVYFDLPLPLAVMSQRAGALTAELDAGCDAQLNVWKGEITDRRDAEVSGRPARECLFDLSEPHASALIRVVRDRSRMYQLMAVWPRGRDPAGMPQRFFGSFKLDAAPSRGLTPET